MNAQDSVFMITLVCVCVCAMVYVSSYQHPMVAIMMFISI